MYEDICYNKNYINEVICRLDFASPIIEYRDSMPKAIYDVVKKYYPIAEPQDVIGTELSINPINGPEINKTVSKQWVFLARDRKNKCTIESTCIVFSIRNYTVFEDAKSAISEIIDAIMSSNPKNQGKRFGLRYINILPLKGHGDWIDEKFYTAVSAHKDEKTIKLLTTLEYAAKDKELIVRLNYGYKNPDYPAVIRREDFYIDIDAYTTGIIYQEDISQFIEDMHNEVQNCFELMITDELRKAMDVCD